MSSGAPIPVGLVVHEDSRVLELAYEDGRKFRLSFEFLRVNSPSAEVRGHGKGQETLQVGKRDVRIESIEPVGHYAILPRFDDGHVSGIYSWDYLYEIATDHDRLWADYLARLERAGKGRDLLPADATASAGAGSGKPHGGLGGPRSISRPGR
ncbi:MAG: DUF971 domain-containing protein [Burkholderiaceae bacterium]